MKNWTCKWGKRFGALFLATALFLSFNPNSAEAAYSENIVPVMTSNTSPTGIASASSEYPNHPAWYAFDGNEETFWAPNPDEGWVAYEFTIPKVITKYSFSIMEDDLDGEYYAQIHDVYLEGYDQENQRWDQLHTVNVYRRAFGEFKSYSFEIDNQKSYKKYRLSYTNDLVDYSSAIFTFGMYETLPSVISPINTNTNHTQGFDFLTPKKLSKVQFNLNNLNSSYSLPSALNIEGYNETTAQWENLSYTGTIKFGSNELVLSNTTAYKKYRLNLDFNQFSSVSLTGLTVYGTD